MAKRQGSRRRQTRLRQAKTGADPAANRNPIEELRYRHAKGKKLLEDFPVGVEAGEPWPKRPQYQTVGLVAKRASEEGITLSELHCRRRFAFLYSDKDLERLCSYEPPLSWSAVRWLLRVRDRDERLSFEQQAAQKGWTAAELKTKIRRKREAHGGGRPPKPVKTFTAGLAATVEAVARLEVLLGQVLTGEHALARKRWPESESAQQRRKELIAAAEAADAALNELRERIDEKR